MTRSVGLAHIIRQGDGSSTGVWGVFSLKTAFQPIYAFANGKLRIAAFEGLVRPFRDGQSVGPYGFFNMVPARDRMHVETLTRTLHLLNAGTFLPRDVSVFVNFDPSLFVEKSIIDTAVREMRLVLHEAGLEAARIVCEVTEQPTASDETLFRFVGALRDQGFRIAVDDFGSDQSDIRRIEDLRPDIVKFDAKWIAKLMESSAGFGLLKAMVDTFAARGIVTVFEGIEENWQLELAEKSGASMVQGYVLARPEIVPASFTAAKPRKSASPPVEEPPETPVRASEIIQRRPPGAPRSFGRRIATRP